MSGTRYNRPGEGPKPRATFRLSQEDHERVLSLVVSKGVPESEVYRMGLRLLFAKEGEADGK